MNACLHSSPQISDTTLSPTYAVWCFSIKIPYRYKTDLNDNLGAISVHHHFPKTETTIPDLNKLNLFPSEYLDTVKKKRL